MKKHDGELGGVLMMRRRKYDVAVDGYRIRNEADFDRVDLSKSERCWKHRKAKLEKRAELGVSW